MPNIGLPNIGRIGDCVDKFMCAVPRSLQFILGLQFGLVSWRARFLSFISFHFAFAFDCFVYFLFYLCTYINVNYQLT